MRGRYLLGLSNANRQAAGVVTGNEVEVELELDPEPGSWSSLQTSPAPSPPILRTASPRRPRRASAGRLAQKGATSGSECSINGSIPTAYWRSAQVRPR
jgi:hypothetical protein